MTGLPSRVLYDIQVTGDFEGRLNKFQAAVSGSQDAWTQLREEFRRNGAVFRKTDSELLAMGDALTEAEIDANALRVQITELTSAERTLAKASNRLVKEQNALNEAYAAENAVLAQAANRAEPAIIQARAEVAATRRLTRQLQELAEKRVFADLAAEAGHKVSADGKRLFDAEAAALERLNKANEKRAIDNALAAKGFAPDATPLRANTSGGKYNQLDDQDREKLRVDFERNLEKQKYIDSLRREFGLEDQIAKKKKEQDRLKKSLQGRAQQLLFTFRRLVGVLAVFTAARKVAQAFAFLVTESVRFNASLEQSRVGMAGLIASSINILNIDGKRVDLAKQLTIAQNIAVDQSSKLRKAALETAASYEELTDAFSQAVAPGLGAGISLDDVRDITIKIALASRALGQANNQLGQEVRSIFENNINRDSRVALALNIRTADLTRAQQMGKMADYLKERLEVVGATADLLAKTFSGRLGIAQDALKQLLATSSTPFFNQLKEGFSDITVAIFDIKKETADFQPEAERAFGGLFQGLARGVRALREEFAKLNVAGIADLFGVVGETIGLLVAAFARLTRTLLNGLSPAVTTLRLIIALVQKALSSINKLDTATGGLLTTVSAMAAQYAVAFFIISRGATFLSGAFGVARLALIGFSRGLTVGLRTLGRLGPVMSFLGKAVALFANPWVLVTAAVVGTVAILDRLLFDNAIGRWLKGVVSSASDAIDSLFEVKSQAEVLAKDITEDGFGQFVKQFAQLRQELQQASEDSVLAVRNLRREIQTAENTFRASPAIATAFQQFQSTLDKDAELVRRLNLELEQTNLAMANIESRVNSFYDEQSGKNIGRFRRDIGYLEEDILKAKEVLDDLYSGKTQVRDPLDLADQAAASLSRISEMEKRAEDFRKKLEKATAEVEKADSSGTLKNLRGALAATKLQAEGLVTSLQEVRKARIDEASLAAVKSLLESRRGQLDLARQQREENVQAARVRQLSAVAEGDISKLLENTLGLQLQLVNLSIAQRDLAEDRRIIEEVLDQISEAGVESEEKAVEVMLESLRVQEAIFGLKQDAVEESARLLAEERRLLSIRLQQQTALDEVDRRSGQLNVAALRNIAQARVGFDREAEELARAQLETGAAKLALERSLLESTAEITTRTEELVQIDRQGSAVAKEIRDAKANQLVIALDLAKTTAERLAYEVKISEEEERRARIRKSGSFGQGFEQGIETFVEQSRSIATIGENFALSVGNGLSNFVGQTFRSSLAAAFDPAQNFDLAAAIRNLGIDLLAGLVTDLARNALGNLFGSLFDVSKTAQLQVAAGSIATALTTGAGALVAAGKETALTLQVATAAMIKAMAAAKIGTTAIGGTIPVANSIGGPIRAGRAGQVVGFASGGSVGKRIRGMDPRDVINARLRPGEWVIRPESASKYGSRIMSLLNAGRINPEALRALAGSTSSAPAAALGPRLGYATGGQVTSSGPEVGRSVGPNVAIQFHDEQTMDRALAAGKDSVLQFARVNRQAYRAALGV